MLNINSIADRFIRYARIHTQSDTKSPSCPSSSCQMDLARMLLADLLEIGCTEVSLNRNGYIMASLPSNVNKEIPVIGFIAHMDTSPDFSGKDVNPQIIKNYAGGDIQLGPTGSFRLS